MNECDEREINDDGDKVNYQILFIHWVADLSTSSCYRLIIYLLI